MMKTARSHSSAIALATALVPALALALAACRTQAQPESPADEAAQGEPEDPAGEQEQESAAAEVPTVPFYWLRIPQYVGDIDMAFECEKEGESCDILPMVSGLSITLEAPEDCPDTESADITMGESIGMLQMLSGTSSAMKQDWSMQDETLQAFLIGEVEDEDYSIIYVFQHLDGLCWAGTANYPTSCEDCPDIIETILSQITHY